MKDKEFNSKGDRVTSRDNDGYTCRVDSSYGTCSNNRTGESVNVARDSDGKWGIDTNNTGPKNIMGNSYSNSNKDWGGFYGNDKDYGDYSGSQSFGNSGNYSGGYSLTKEQEGIALRNKVIMKGFTGNVLGGANHDQRHCRDYSEKPQVNKEMLAAARTIDNKNNSKAVNFILFHDCYLNDDDMYWLSSIFNTHTPKGLAVNTVDLSNNCLTLVRDSNLGYVDLPFFSFNSPYNTPRNILRLDLSNNQIGDAGAKVVADGLANGVFPITKQINLSGNNITDTGKGFIANMMHKLNQGLVVTLETINNVSKETFKIGVKAMLSMAKNNGISTKEALTTEETIEHCKKGIPNVGYNLSWGVIKCFTGADTPIALYQKDVHSLVVKTTVNVINPLKKPMQFVCMTQETFFSVVDEDFANCLTGVDSGLND